jgi:hypothetical protein
MIQTVLLPDTAGVDRWQPVVPPFRLRPFTRTIKRKPLPGQLFLPGMEDDDEALRLREDDSAAHGRETDRATVCSQPKCPNCGGTEFDDDGDCSSCLEPGVVKPA